MTEGSTLSEAERDQLAMVQRAIEDGFDLNRADDAGRTLLMMASFEGLDAVVGLLLDNGAALDQRDAQGRTALMFAASGPFPDTVELLLRHGATVDAVDATEGWTPLMFAAGEGQLEVVEVLLTHGADPCLTDDDGDAAADHASVQGHDALAESLARTCNE